MMRKLVLVLVILISTSSYSNPVIMPPVISEFFYNDGDWQLEIYFDSEIHGLAIPGLNSFDLLCLECNAGIALFYPGISFVWDSLYVIDQSWLSSVFLVDPYDDYINVLGYDNGSTYWIGEAIYYYSNSSSQPPPGPGESIAIQYVYTMAGDWPEFIQMKQSPPTIGSNPFTVDSRASFSGYVFDQFQNPLEGVEFVYCDISYCNGFSTPVFYCFQTDNTGYFECDSLFPMFHRFDLTYEAYVYTEHNLFMEPDQPAYQEYTLYSVGTNNHKTYSKTTIKAAPNPFSHKTSFQISMPDYQRWEQGQITIRSISGQVVDVINFPNAVWSGNEFSIDWYPAMTANNVVPGLYLYTLEIDNNYTISQKIILNE